ncbi:hypothetical protein PF010_g3275 [Phytophthora fragariae]|uniref:Uncharacterized protein n=1 Tax=Phytophthora fragariae TaxID=53985 RepID=A0A6A4AAY9_9STRA|nr:hypothetical protein PF010_g3275 [Phytophthora fragariae]KAE9152685.1 hypothetical protein PF006_g3130 [Phytophthora fragariae]KAE9252164.1 hypothetical protein PF002_g3956 [Phytophthora fragariae]KAE9359124.1 hypothetical protein PF008_g2381 [Phytophthora fragariae]
MCVLEKAGQAGGSCYNISEIEGGLTEPGTAELPELDTEVLVAHLCAKLVGSKCPGYEKDELRRNFKTGKYGKARLRHYFAL